MNSIYNSTVAFNNQEFFCSSLPILSQWEIHTQDSPATFHQAKIPGNQPDLPGHILFYYALLLSTSSSYFTTSLYQPASAATPHSLQYSAHTSL